MIADPRLTQLGAMGIKPAAAKRIVRRVNKSIPVGWLTVYLPRHFGNQATRRYGYTPRSGERGSGRPFKGSYTQHKLRTHGHTRPLEYTGGSRRSAETNNRATSTINSASAVMPGARGYNRRYSGSKINMNQELTRVLEEENQNLDRQATRKADVEYRRAGKRHR